MTFYLEIETKRFLRKPLIEGFLLGADTEDEVRRINAKYRPKSRIVWLQEVQKIGLSKRG